jgi:ATP/maltotriose-dependent transcriptional regulator MalT
MTLGHACAGLGKMEEAAEAYRQATTIRQQIGQPHLAVESLAGLARVGLARGDTSSALAHVEEILESLQARSLDGTSERFRVPLTCYQVLRATGDPRATSVLQGAVEQLQVFARTIDDARLRRTFLENVPWHRELLAATAD